MCGGSLKPPSPKKALKSVTNPKEAIANGFGLTPGLGHEIGKITDRVGRATGNDKFAAHLDPFNINKGKTRVEKRMQQEATAEAAALEAEQQAQAKAQMDATVSDYNKSVIEQKRRRRNSSVLARTGGGLSDTSSVLASAGTYGKTTTGA